MTSEHSQTEDRSNSGRIVLVEVPRPLRPWSRYEDQIYAKVPDDFEVQFVGGRTELEGVHIVHASGSLDRLIGISHKTRPKERLFKTREFVESLRRNKVQLVRTIHCSDKTFNDSYDQEASELLDRHTALFIGVDIAVIDKERGPAVVIPYADLSDRFAGYPTLETQMGRMLAIAPLGDDAVAQALAKTIEFSRLPDLSVRIGGEATPAFKQLMSVKTSSYLIAWRNENLSDGALIEEITASELVFPPDTNSLYGYHMMMMALSFNRPVAVPDMPITRSLISKYGSRRVLLYKPPLTASKIDALISELRRSSGTVETTATASSMSETSDRYFGTFRQLVSSLNAINEIGS